MIQYLNLDRETVKSHFADFYVKRGNSEYKMLLGKLVVWAEQFHKTGTLTGFLKHEFQFDPKINLTHIYCCTKLFRAIHTKKLPGVSEATYDALVQNDAIRVSPMIGDAPSEQIPEEIAKQIADKLLSSIAGRCRPRRGSKDPNFTRSGNVYILVSSAHPTLTKFGRTYLDPYARARELSRRAGVASNLVVVWHELVSDFVAVETALKQRFVTKKHDQGGDEWFRVTPKEAIPILVELAKLHSLPNAGQKRTARKLLSEM